jgi:hypothetical protein
VTEAIGAVPPSDLLPGPAMPTVPEDKGEGIGAEENETGLLAALIRPL